MNKQHEQSTTHHHVSKHWQKRNSFVLHSALAASLLVFLLGMRLDAPLALRIALIASGTWFIYLLTAELNQKYARSYVKVYVTDHSSVSRATQSYLNGQFLPFTKRTRGHQVIFDVYNGQRVTVEEYPLNLPVDSHIKTVPAVKVTLSPLPKPDAAASSLCSRLDEAFAEMG